MEIHWTHCDEIHAAEREKVEARLHALAQENGDLIDVRLTGHGTRHHRQGGREVRIACQARGREIVSVGTGSELGVALNEAVDDFEREVRRLRSRRQQRGRQPDRGLPPILGIVDRVFHQRGYGFVLTDRGDQVYFHQNATQGGLRFEELEEGQRVGLQIEAGEKGPQATAVTPVPPDVPGP